MNLCDDLVAFFGGICLLRYFFWGWGGVVGTYKCAMVKSRYIGDGHPTFNRNPYDGYINPYCWVDDHPLLYGNNGSLDSGTNDFCGKILGNCWGPKTSASHG